MVNSPEDPKVREEEIEVQASLITRLGVATNDSGTTGFCCRHHSPEKLSGAAAAITGEQLFAISRDTQIEEEIHAWGHGLDAATMTREQMDAAAAAIIRDRLSAISFKIVADALVASQARNP